MTTVARLVRSVGATDFLGYLRGLGIGTDALGTEPCADAILSLLSEADGARRDQVIAYADRICAMADEVGQAALLSLPDWRERLLSVEGAHSRAHWLHEQSATAFRQAEEIRYADEYQNAQRLWDGFIGPINRDARTDEEVVKAFATELKHALLLDRIHVEAFDRVRAREGEPDRGVIQFVVYSEGVPEDELVFGEAGVQSRTRKPIRETAITYEPASGTIEVIGRQKATRKEVAAIFARAILISEITGETLPDRRFDLTPLLDEHPFPTSPVDGISRVKLTRLAVSPSDRRFTETFQVPFREPATLQAVVCEHQGGESPFDGDLYPWSARIEVEFEPEAGRRRGKKINIDISAPNKCNLRGKTKKEQLLLSDHLRRWGILRGAAA